MAEFNQFGSARPGQGGDVKNCGPFEAMLAEAVDGSLSADDQAAFDLHLVGCANCREMLADAKRGAAWMEMLRDHKPEPPAALLERILAQTSGARLMSAGAPTEMALHPAAGVLDGGAGVATVSNVLPFRRRALGRFDVRGLGHTLLQPRLAMTAAMAFFSIALTLNLTGVRLSELRASDLKPSSLKRSMYEANAHVVRYYTNLRVVYELESRVHDLQRSTDNEPPASAPEGSSTGNTTDPQKAEPGSKNDPGSKNKEAEPEKPPPRRTSPGTSRREPIRDDQRVLAGIRQETRTAPSEDVLAMLPPKVHCGMQERGTV